MEDRKKILEAYIADLGNGHHEMDDYIPKDQSKFNRAMDARDLAQESLAHEVMKNTGIPIPDKSASHGKVEDFLNRIVAERYPEFKGNPNLSLRDLSKHGAGGLHYDGKIEVDSNLFKQNPTGAVGTALHEAGHKFDHDVLGRGIGETLEQGMKNVRDNGLVKHADPADMFEALAKNHHANIPNLREGSYGLGALKSLLKSGTFKTVAGALPFAGTAMALSSGDANAAASELPSEIPVVGQVYDAIRSDNAGSSDDDKHMIVERNAAVDYTNSPAHQARLNALKSLK